MSTTTTMEESTSVAPPPMTAFPPQVATEEEESKKEEEKEALEELAKAVLNDTTPSQEDIFATCEIVEETKEEMEATTKAPTERFERGDHVYQWCSLMGIPGVFQHHGIVIHVEDVPAAIHRNDDEGDDDDEAVEQLLTIVDFSNLLVTERSNVDASLCASTDLHHDDDHDELMEDDDDSYYTVRVTEELEAVRQHQQQQGSMPFLKSASSGGHVNGTVEYRSDGCLRVYTTHSTKACKWHKVVYSSTWAQAHLLRRSGTCTPTASDPPALVMKRVNLLLSQMSLLPKYHSIFANCECVCVWVKTGTWSTLQASSMLSHAAVGQVKGTAALASLAAAQTVTVPASGIMGWFGVTSTVPLMSVNPFILPALCAYGAVSVGGPAVCLAVAKKKWKKTSEELNNALAAQTVEVELIS